MLFRRREKATQWERFKLWLWPRVSWRRSALYFAKRTLRLSGTPHAIALGCAVGAFASFTPFLGLHFIIAVVIAWLLRGNLIAGALGTFVGNPLSFPLIWVGTYEVGQLILRGGSTGTPDLLAEASAGLSFQELLPLVQPMFVGSIPLGLAAGCLIYFIVHRAVIAYRKGRSARFTGKQSKDAGSVSEGSSIVAGTRQES
jgi:uncharacterized protein (DUF2062 family)